MDPRRTLISLAETFRRRQRKALRSLVLAALGAATVSASLIARAGTTWMRLLAAAVVGVVVLSFFLRGMLERRRLREPAGIVSRLILPVDEALGQRLLRALRLAERAAVDAVVGSRELAELYVARSTRRVRPGLVEARVAKLSRMRRWATWALGGAAFVVLVADPFRVYEGIDVLLARAGRAPFSMTWLGMLRASTQAPAYLRSPERVLFPGNVGEEAAGAVITVHGVEERSGRRLVLTDGQREVPFTSDAAGGVVARWNLEQDVKLWVAARFGDVLVLEPDPLELRAMRDAPPAVAVEDTPRTVELSSLERLELRYEVTDDHGLREVDLVMRSGGREDRRVLGRLDGESRFERGAHALDPRDAFLRRAFLPIVLTIEARDNDVTVAYKWGRSQPVTVMPPAVGEPEALRYKSLAAARGKLVDLLALLLEPGDPSDAQKKAELERRRSEQLKLALGAVRDATSQVSAGLPLSAGAKAFMLGQARALEQPALTDEARQHKTEEVLLAIDAALRALGQRDAETVSKRLGDVAEEVADALRQAQEFERRQEGLTRYQAALTALDRGAAQLVVLDALGRDIGSVAQGESHRIVRGMKEGSYFHAELAARHLAARLRRPRPSFGSADRSPGVEAGERGGGGEPSGEPSQANQRFNQLMEELQKLQREHQNGLEGVERTLDDAEDAAELEALKQEAADRARKLREKLEGLPQPGATPGSARGRAGLGREQASAMAQDLEKLLLKDAIENGQNARNELEQAERKPSSPRDSNDAVDKDALNEARRELDEQLGWAKEQLSKLRQKAEQRAKNALEQSSQGEQRMAGRAGNLAGQGAHGEATLPEDVVDALEQAESVMRQAARELENGHGQRGLELQREAQRLLEQADRGGLDQEDDRGREPPPKSDRKSTSSPNGKEMKQDIDVPHPDDRRAAEEFRKRVLEGLSREKGLRLSPAVQRYAEGLLE